MILTDRQRDSLKELINIAFGKAVSSLSELTGYRIIIDVPKIDIYSIDEIIPHIEGLVTEEVATVHQIFTGRLAGDAFLLLDQNGAKALTSLLIDEQVETIDVSVKEVLIELGNIILNACLGTFGNMLNVHITFSVPRLHLSALNDMLSSLVIGKEGIRYALLIATKFKLKGSKIGGYLVIVLGVGSLDKLLEEVEKLG